MGNMTFNTTTGCITIPESGYYQMTTSFYVSAAGGGFITMLTPNSNYQFQHLFQITNTISYGGYATGSYFGYLNAGTIFFLNLQSLKVSDSGVPFYPNGYWSIYKTFS